MDSKEALGKLVHTFLRGSDGKIYSSMREDGSLDQINPDLEEYIIRYHLGDLNGDYFHE
jgi:hypothetical protein